MTSRERGRATNAILFTDLVASTELRGRQGEDEADRFGVEEHHRVSQVVGAQEGWVVKGMGDGLLAAFAGAADALDAAVAIQQTSPHPVRVGVSIGDVTWDRGDCFGYPVVEAARLVARAAPGEILVADLVRVLARGRGGHEFVSLGSVELKGLAQPVEVSRLIWTAPPPATVVAMPTPLASMAETAFVGRATELAELESAWAAALEGRRQVVLVAADAGAGKSCLAAEFARRVHEAGATVLFGGAEDELAVPYQPVVETLEHLTSAVGDDRVRRWAGRGADDLAHLLPRLGTATEGNRYQVFGAIVDLLRGITADGPVFWVVDDLQWAGRPSMLLLVHVLRVAPDLPLMLFAIHRDPEGDQADPLSQLLADLRRLTGIRRLRLSGLSVDEVTTMVGDETLAHTLVDHTGGNPYFVTELHRHLREGGSLDRAPAGPAEVITHRVSRLSPEAQNVLTLAAVIGFSFELDLVRAAGEGPVLDGLEEAQRAHLIDEEPGPRIAYRFSHALTRTALYDRLTVTRRAQLHHDVAVGLETLHLDPEPVLTRLARHWSEAAGLGDPLVAVFWCRRAASQAVAALGFEEAADHLRRALELAGPDCPSRLRTELLVELARALNGAGQWASSLDTAVKAGELAQADGADDLLVAAALSFAGAHAVWAVARDRRARELVRTALDRCPVDTIEQASLLSKLAAVSLFVTPVDERIELCGRALQILHQGDERLDRHRVLSEFWTAINPRYDGEMYAGVLSELATLGAGPGVESRWNYTLSRAEQLAALADGTALRALINDFQEGERLSDASRTYLLNIRGNIALWDGDFARAGSLFVQAAEAGSRELWHLALATYAIHTTTLGWLQGDVSAAWQVTEEFQKRVGGPVATAMFSWVKLCCGDSGSAQQFLSGFRDWDFFLRFVGAGQGLAVCSLAAVELGDRQAMIKACEVWGQITAELYSSAITPTLARSYYEGVLMHGMGDLEQAEERLRHSLVVHDRLTAVPHRAASLAALAAVLVDAGHVHDGIALAVEAAESARHCGALGIVRRAEHVLHGA